MPIVEFDRPPSWTRDASKIGENTKCPWSGMVEDAAGGKKRELVNSFTLVSGDQETWLNFGASAVKVN